MTLTSRAAATVVDQEVQPPEGLQRTGDHALRVRLHLDARADAEHAPAASGRVPLQLGHGGVERLLHAEERLMVATSP
jgi:hypothetical protein